MTARLAVVALAIALASPAAAQQFVHHRSERSRDLDAATIRAVGVRTLPATRGPTLSAEARENEDDEREALERQFPPGAGTGVLPAPMPPREGLQRTQSFAYTWAPEQSFDGPTKGAWAPADPAIAAGPGHLVLATNITVTFWDKSQQKYVYADSLGGMLGCPAGYRTLFDPKVVYDETSGRFYITALTYDPVNNLSLLQLAASKTSDPTQGWWIYSIHAEFDRNALDYEDIGFGPRGVYVAGNYVSSFFNSPPLVNHTNVVWVFTKSELIAGQGLDWYSAVDLQGLDNQKNQTIRAAQCQETPPAGLDGMLVQGQVRSSEPTKYYVNVWGVTLPANFPTSGPAYALQSVATDFPGAPVNCPQQGGSDVLLGSQVGANLLSAQFRHSIVATSCTMSAGGRDIARALGVGVGSWPTLAIATQSDLASNVNHYFFPGAAINRFADYAVSAGFSGASVYGSMRGAVIPTGYNIFYPDFDVQDGDAYYNVFGTSTQERWGDYGGAAVDPVSQNFWLFHMYADTTKDGFKSSTWTTRVTLVPRAVFVDGSAGGFIQAGTVLQPYHTIPGGNAAALSGNDLVIRAGTYPAGITLATPVRVIPDGGVVQIGP